MKLNSCRRNAAAIFVCISCLSMAPLRAQVRIYPQKPSASASQNKIQLKYDAYFEYLFDNSEFDANDNLYTDSYTLHSARLTPSVGFSYAQNDKITHSLMVGVDIMKNMGESETDYTDDNIDNIGLFREVTFWYGLDANLRNMRIKGYAGIFPRRFSVFGSQYTNRTEAPGVKSDSRVPVSGNDVPTLFLSDYYRYHDNNLEGFLVSASGRDVYLECSLDWLGMYGQERREQFKVNAFGKGRIAKGFYGGLALEVHHYANATEYGHVIDSFVYTPFLQYDFAQAFDTKFQRLSLAVNWLGTVHRDREYESGMLHDGGVQISAELMYRNVGFRAEEYLGNGMMNYYSVESPEGGIYGTDLYHGNVFYRDEFDNHIDYTRLELYFQPRIADFLDLRVSLVGHIAEGTFQGWQQRFGLIFSLDRLLNPKKPAPASGRRTTVERHYFVL